jgi:predicted enzyme related to lactoylglutathione lyase
MSNNIATWFEIYVTDMDRAKTFYETITGKTLMPMPMPEEMGMTMVAFPWTEEGMGAAGALVKSDMRTPNAEGTIIYLDSEDCDTELSRVEAAGGKVIFPKTPAGGYGFFCMFSDTEGNTVGFFSKK